jgi:hypothetical protein
MSQTRSNGVAPIGNRLFRRLATGKPALLRPAGVCQPAPVRAQRPGVRRPSAAFACDPPAIPLVQSLQPPANDSPSLGGEGRGENPFVSAGRAALPRRPLFFGSPVSAGPRARPCRPSAPPDVARASARACNHCFFHEHSPLRPMEALKKHLMQVVVLLRLGQPGGLPDSSRGLSVATPPDRVAKQDRTPEGCQIWPTAQKTSDGSSFLNQHPKGVLALAFSLCNHPSP